jgi:EAL domain-containing protein (putative c-di-GMP-specific phosphodiesterase class I)
MANTGKGKKAAKGLSELLGGLVPGGNEKPAPSTSRFEISLDDLNKKYSATVVSRMQILNLKKLIVRRERDMDEALKKADVIAQAVIEDALQDGDAFIHPETGVYGFLFPSTSKSAAELKCSIIAEQVARLLKNSNITLSSIEFEASTKRRAGRSLAEKLASQQAAAQPGKQKKPSAESQSEIVRKRRMANLAIQQMTMRRQRDTADSKAHASAWWPATGAGAAADDGSSSDISTVFRAVWNVKNRYLTAYLATPAMKSPDDDNSLALRIAADADNSAIADCDQFVQEEALKKLHLLVNAGHKVLLILPIHFSTVDRNDYYAIYFQRIRSLDEKNRKLLVLELIDAPPDLTDLKIKETVTRLRQAARSVIVRGSLDGLKAEPWGAAGIHAIGFDCGEQSGVERALMERMNNFAARAEKAGVRKFVYGLAKRSLATAAVSAGFDYIEGNIVRPPVEAPDIIQPFDSQNLFAGLASR